MATKTTTTGNPRQRKQLIFIAIGGVVLLGLAFFQGPKLWKQINPPAPAAPAKGAAAATGAAGATGGAAAVAAPLTGSAVVVKPSPRPGATTVVAGVDVQPWQVPQATTGQLWTFSRLHAKDPFVQQVDDKSSITPVAPFAGATNSSRTTSTSTATTTTTTQPKQASATTAPAQLPPMYATIEVNGNELRLKVDQAFPPSTKVFELAALKPKSAEIVLASGGKIGKNGKLVLTMGKPLTLVNAATGKRYTMKLLYTGSTPEVVQQFSTKAK
jgi:hypothetical protein